jgi:choice-of-anchor A domain-containing protein
VELEVNTRNRMPIADCGPDREVNVGDVVQLDSSSSYDPDFDALMYRWALLSVPEGSLCALDNATVPDPVFTADMPGAYIIQLIVNDAEFDSIPVTCVITTRNRSPVAVATAEPAETLVGETIYLSAEGSSDPDGDALEYIWQIVSAPQGSIAVINDAYDIEASFVPDIAGEYQFLLSVHDGSATDSTQVMITTIDDDPECGDDLGLAADYSIFALSWIEMNNGTVAGRIAAGGDVVLQNVVVGKHAEISSPEEGVLVAGGDIDYSKGTIHTGSIIAAGSVDGVSRKVRRKLSDGASVTGYAELPFNFAYEAGNLQRLSARLADIEPKGEIKQCKNTLKLYGDGLSDIQIFNIDMQQLGRASSLQLKNIDNDSSVIINVGGEGVVENIGMAIPGKLHDRVLFNFYEAQTLAFRSVALKGSVLAPYAEFKAKGGEIFGNVIVDIWHGSMKDGHNDDDGCGCVRDDDRNDFDRNFGQQGGDGDRDDDDDDRGRGRDRDRDRDDDDDCQRDNGSIHIGQKPFVGLLPACSQ